MKNAKKTKIIDNIFFTITILTYITSLIVGDYNTFDDLHGLNKIIAHLPYYYPIVMPLISVIISTPFIGYPNSESFISTIMVFLTFACLLFAVKQNIFVFSWTLILISSLSLWTWCLIGEYANMLLLNPHSTPLICLIYKKKNNNTYEHNSDLKKIFESINRYKNSELHKITGNDSIKELRNFIQNHKQELSNKDCEEIIENIYDYTNASRTDIYNIIEIEAILNSTIRKRK